MTIEKNIDLDWIPILHNGVRWEKISDNHYLLFNDSFGTKMFVSFSTISIVGQINGADSIRVITDKLTEGKAKAIDYKRIKELFQNDLYKNGILETNDINTKKKSHIHLEKIIIPGNTLWKICNCLLFLFKKNIALPVLFFCIFTVGWTIFNTQLFSQSELGQMNYSIFFISLAALIIFHEFGHCTALQYYGKKSNGIGFGFYFFSPVLYADVNPSWTLSGKKRIVVDMGGFYFQLIVTTIYLLLYSVTDQNALLNVAILSFFLFLFNLNPFINTDMYWFIADLLKYSNLNKESMNEVAFLFKKGPPRRIKKFLVCFGIVKIIFITFIFTLISYLMFKTTLDIFQGNYTLNFRKVMKDCIIVLGFFFFMKEISGIMFRRMK